MGYKITYTDKRSGERRTHEYTGSRNGAENWARGLSADNDGCRAECWDHSHAPFHSSEPPTHVITVGHDKQGGRGR